MVRQCAVIVAALVLGVTCDGTTINTPMSPSVVVSADREHPALSRGPSGMPPGPVPAESPAYPHHGLPTEVWLVPAPEGDLLELFRRPDDWARARAQTDVIGLFHLSAYHHDGFVCGKPCGPNTLQALTDADAFNTISNVWGKRLSVEAPAVKSHNCDVPDRAGEVNRSIANIKASGGRVDYVSMDEPFFSGTNDPFTPGFGGCGQTLAWTAEQIARYVNDIHAEHPEVRVGLIEPYPSLSADLIISALLELEALGVRLPFFHLDLNVRHASETQQEAVSDVRRLRAFCAARGIPFGVLIFGEDGSSNETFFAGAWATFLFAYTAVGMTEHTVHESWAEQVPGNLTSAKAVPNVLPDSDPGRHTGFVLRVNDYLRR